MNKIPNSEIVSVLKLAKSNPYGYPFAALLYNPKTRASLYSLNMVKELKDATAHAEMMALRNLSKCVVNLRDWVIISSGEPCPMCLTAIAWSGIKEVYYVDDYTVANKRGYKFDRDSRKVNKLLNLGLKITKLYVKKI